jgi:hypothetical protein
MTDGKKKIREMTDAEIGTHVRKMMIKYPKEFDSQVMCAEACGRILTSIAAEMNGDELKFTIGGATYQDREIGDWEVLIKRTKKPKSR